jgi:hypothetical protein
MPPVWFEPAIPALEWPQTHALDRTAIRNGRREIRVEVIE